MDSTMDDNKEGNLHAESFSSRQLKCHDPWATAGIRCKLMEELPFCVNQEEIKHFFLLESGLENSAAATRAEHKVS